MDDTYGEDDNDIDDSASSSIESSLCSYPDFTVSSVIPLTPTLMKILRHLKFLFLLVHSLSSILCGRVWSVEGDGLDDFIWKYILININCIYYYPKHDLQFAIFW